MYFEDLTVSNEFAINWRKLKRRMYVYHNLQGYPEGWRRFIDLSDCNTTFTLPVPSNAGIHQANLSYHLLMAVDVIFLTSLHSYVFGLPFLKLFPKELLLLY